MLYWNGYDWCKSCSARSGFNWRSGNLKIWNLEIFLGGGEVEENLLIGVKKRSIINSKKIISKIIIRGIR